MMSPEEPASKSPGPEREAVDIETAVTPPRAAGQFEVERPASERVKGQALRVLDEIEATPVIGSAYDWLRAVALGVKDTATVMRDEARKGAHEAEREGWARFDSKTKYRRKK